MIIIKTLGVIAEFNPLHNGHVKFLQTAIEISKASACVIVLSSDFTQRGSPALVDKYYRAEMAIKAGADLVFELPFIYSCSAGQDFSAGGVDILGLTGIADAVSFGMENPEFELEKIVDALIYENDEYKNFLRDKLKSGASFSKASSLALDHVIPGAGDFIKQPNNLLAVSYLTNIRRKYYDLAVFPVKRSEKITSSEIRHNIYENAHMMPDFTQDIINIAEQQNKLCVNYKLKLWEILQAVLNRAAPQELKAVHGIDEGLENLFIKKWPDAENFDSFLNYCVSMRYTRAHLRRRVIYILTGLARWHNLTPDYVRVLAFNSKGRRLLREAKSKIRIVSKLSEAPENFISQSEIKASRLYNLLLPERDLKREFQPVLQL